MKYMKNRIRCSIQVLVVLLVLSLSMASCEYDSYVDAKYPEQMIYMPTAKQNIYKIDAVPMAIGSVPTPGYPIRFVTDTVARQFKVLLGVYRSGINNDGGFNVNIGVNNDTIAYLKSINKLPAVAELLTSDLYTLPTEVSMKDGEEISKFELVLGMDFLRNNMTKQYAVAVNVSSPDRKTSIGLGTTIILINPVMMKPTANFSSVADGANPKLIKFTNTSTYGMNYTWSFGDGSTMKTSNAVNTAVTHTYAAAGTYTVTLSTYGVTDSADKAVKTLTVTVL